MSNKHIQSLLKDALEEEIPSSQVDLWPAIKVDLAAGMSPHPQEERMMNISKSYQITRLALAFSLSIALLVILTATPQGRTFAQGILELFNRAEETEFPLEDVPVREIVQSGNAATAEPPAPLISEAEAEARVGFRIAQLPETPEGLEFLGARLYGDTVSLEYQTPDMGGHLVIMQSQKGYYESDWDNVPAGSVVQVDIGALNGEFVQGTFVVYPGANQATWNPDAAILRLRWVNNGTWFEIAKYGDTAVIEYIDQAGLVALAKSLAPLP